MPKKKLDDDSGPPIRHFKLASNQTLMQTGYVPLVHPNTGGGLVLLTSPGGLPVIRHHRDLRPGEINFVLR